ncbi:melanoma receptor tyrosine-protein kinase-like [Sycon ciliatum]|uniref:melanoma receptor tyrosine-protein kinase-like n=1 Tax=Sycon ciliatum TaxID=27933 RepID=UPI0031F71C0A
MVVCCGNVSRLAGKRSCDTYVGCSAYSCGKRCNLTSQICCYSQCAGGCTGYGDTKCVSCAGKRLVLDNGQTRCVSSCPPLTTVDRRTSREVANPDGRYNHELDCVKSCADVNRLTYKQDCVRTCPLNTEDDDNGVCQPCAPFCKRICFGTDQLQRKVLDASYLKNNLTGCTIIDGDLRIGIASFSPDPNHPQAIPLNANNPSELDALLTVQNIKGCLYLDNALIADVSFLRNVQKIGKCTTSNVAAFSILVIGTKSKVTYLGLSSLRSVQGNAYFTTSNLCYVDTLNRWDNITSNLFDQTTANCTGTVCNSLCSSDGCLGPNPTDCYECKHVSFGGTCFQNCADATLALNEPRPVYLDAKTSECRICNSLCFPYGCTGPTNQECLSCPKLKLGGSCVDTCPEGTYLNTATSECQLCSIVCQATGSTSPQCTGPGTHLGAGGCTQCSTGVYDSTGKLENCVSQCPAATTYSTGVITTDGVQECRYCNTQCTGGCHGPAATECTLCKNNFRTVSGSKLRQCVQSCDAAQDYISQHECLSCNMQCSGGCNGSSAMDCTACKTAFQIQDGGKRLCLASCPQKTFSKTVGLLRQCVDECDTGMYNNTDGVCLPCHEQCASSCIASGNSVLSCAGLCKFFAEEGNCVQECGASYRADEETGECVGASNEEPDNAQEQKPSSLPVIAGSAGGGLAALLLIAALACLACKRGESARQCSTLTVDQDNLILDIVPPKVAPNTAELKIATEHDISTGDMLGEGSFGHVYKGEWSPPDSERIVVVAVKVLKETAGSAGSSEFLDEAVVMASMNHPYLVRLLCICMAPRVMLITELMEHGSLLAYLRKRKRTLTGDVLLLFGRQIAEGMEYLEAKRVIHRDLAARNVLVADHDCVKITDFGLAQLLDVGSEKFQHTSGKMPVKWLAPESLEKLVFTHQTDVWSYGVTLWEVLTHGEEPYKEAPSMASLLQQLSNGLRLPKPPVVGAALYRILTQCWTWKPSQRPNFTSLVSQLSDMCQCPNKFINIQITVDSKVELVGLSSHGQAAVHGRLNEPNNYTDLVVNETATALETVDSGHAGYMQLSTSQASSRDYSASRTEFAKIPAGYMELGVDLSGYIELDGQSSGYTRLGGSQAADSTQSSTAQAGYTELSGTQKPGHSYTELSKEQTTDTNVRMTETYKPATRSGENHYENLGNDQYTELCGTELQESYTQVGLDQERCGASTHVRSQYTNVNLMQPAGGTSNYMPLCGGTSANHIGHGDHSNADPASRLHSCGAVGGQPNAGSPPPSAASDCTRLAHSTVGDYTRMPTTSSSPANIYMQLTAGNLQENVAYGCLTGGASDHK